MSYKPKILAPSEGGTGSNNTATSGKVLIGNGTNFVSSTPTYPTSAGSSGNVLTSDGTNWTSAAASGGGVLHAKVVITSAQVKALRASPITIVAAGGSGTIIKPISLFAKLTYGGNNAFTNGQAIDVSYGAAGSSAAGGTDMITAVGIVKTTNQLFGTGVVEFIGNGSTYANYHNLPLVCENIGGSEITGNAANDNTLTIEVIYYIATV